MTSKYTKELLEKLSNILTESDGEPDPEGEDNDEGIKYKIRKSGDWIDEGKYSYREVIYTFPDLDVLVSVSESRSGSYFTDYEYNDPDYSFVEEKEKTVVVKRYIPVEAV